MRKLQLEELNRMDAEAFKQAEKLPVALVLDNIRSLNNVGSAFRTGDALAVEKICLCGITGTPPHKEIHKTALGAQDTVAWQKYDSTSEAIQNLKNEDYTIIALEQTDESTSLQQYAFEADKKYAFIFGNEVFGVENEALALCDACLEIPQFGTKHSFNVSVTMGIVLWDYFSKSRKLM